LDYFVSELHLQEIGADAGADAGANSSSACSDMDTPLHVPVQTSGWCERNEHRFIQMQGTESPSQGLSRKAQSG
jgi:hypothetical protein